MATTTIPPREVECALTLIIDDAVRVWLDGVCLLDEWSWHPARVELSLPIAPSDQPSSLVVEYFEVGEPACMIVRYFNGARPFEPEPIPESQSLRYAELLDSLANLYEQIDACDKAESARSRAQAIRNGFDDQ